MASGLVAGLGGALVDRVVKSVIGDTKDFHSLETTEMAAQSANVDSKTTMNVAPVMKEMNVVNSQGSISQAQVQPTESINIKNILAAPTQVTHFLVGPSTARGSVLYQTRVTPRDINSENTTRMAWIAQLFQFWTGNMVFTVMFTKTILIQSKMIMVFCPDRTEDDAAPTPDEAIDYDHKVIMNPANEQAYHLDVPYVSTTPWLKMNEYTGMLYFIVYDPLVISVGDTNSIPVNIFVSASGIDMREKTVVPTLNTNYIPFIPADFAYTICAPSTALINTTVVSGLYPIFFADDGTLISTQVQRYSAATVVPAKLGVPHGATNFLSVPAIAPGVRYASNVCATLWGEPLPTEAAVLMHWVAVRVDGLCLSSPTPAYAWLCVYASARGSIWLCRADANTVVYPSQYKYDDSYINNLWKFPAVFYTPTAMGAESMITQYNSRWESIWHHLDKPGTKAELIKKYRSLWAEEFKGAGLKEIFGDVDYYIQQKQADLFNQLNGVDRRR